MKIQKKYIWATAIALVSGTAALGYLQFKKIMNYTLTMVGIRNPKLSATGLDFDILYEYQNKADIDVTLREQEYEVYVDNIYMTTLSNYAPNVLKASQASPITIGVRLNFSDFKGKFSRGLIAKMIADPASVEIKTIMKWKVTVLGILRFPARYTYKLTLKEIIDYYK